MFNSTRVFRPLALAHVASSWFMVGLIWTIHSVHYPLFSKVGDATYVAFQSSHVERIGRLLLLPWLVEGVTLLWVLALAFLGGRKDLRVPAALGALGMAVVLVISGFWSAPAHGELADGFDSEVHARLMDANLVRTLAWTVCGVAATWVLAVLWSNRTTTSTYDA